MVDSGGLLNRYTGNSVSGVRIPPSPLQEPSEADKPPEITGGDDGPALGPTIVPFRQEAPGTDPERPPTATKNATRATPADPELAALVDAWPALPEAVRAGIVAMVRATLRESDGR